MTGRAMTPTQKREVLERVLLAWERVPEQRLGQLITNAFGAPQNDGAANLFYVEDVALAEGLERYVPK